MAELSIDAMIREIRHYEALAEKPMPVEERAAWLTIANNYRLRLLCEQLGLDWGPPPRKQPEDQP